MLKALFCATLFSLCASAYGQDQDQHPIDIKLRECLDADDNTLAINGCLEQAYKDWDKEMNKVYNQLMKKLPAEGQTALKNSQKAWLTHRDLEIKNIRAVYGHIYDLNGGGTMYPTMASGRVTDLVKDRTLELSDLLGDIELFVEGKE